MLSPSKTNLANQLAKPLSKASVQAHHQARKIVSSARSIGAYRACNQSGFSTLTWLLAIPAFLIAGLIAAVIFYEGRKAYWDAQVKEMCAKDGGVTIYEQIALSKAEYDRLGGQGGIVPVPSERQSSIQSPFASKRIEKTINEGNPKVYRVDNLFIRDSDQKVMALSVRYARTGGDFPSFAHPSSLLCPDQIQSVAQERKIFLIEGGDK